MVKHYLSRGPRARAAGRHALGQARTGLAAPETSMASLHAEAAALLEATLLAAGYRRHNYGPWRKRRGHRYS